MGSALPETRLTTGALATIFYPLQPTMTSLAASQSYPLDYGLRAISPLAPLPSNVAATRLIYRLRLMNASFALRATDRQRRWRVLWLVPTVYVATS